MQEGYVASTSIELKVWYVNVQSCSKYVASGPPYMDESEKYASSFNVYIILDPPTQELMYTHTHSLTDSLSHTLTHVHAQCCNTLANVRTHTHTHTHTHVHTQCSDTLANVSMRTHTHSHTHTRTPTYLHISTSAVNSLLVLDGKLDHCRLSIVGKLVKGSRHGIELGVL